MEPFLQSSTNNRILNIDRWTRNFPVAAGISTRNGGFSHPPYDTLNCAIHVGDDPENVLKNRAALCEAVGFSFSSWRCAKQVHGNHILEMTGTHQDLGRVIHEAELPEADGLYTREKGILLASFYADCVPLFFYDPVNRIIGIAHAGWRGTTALIGKKMVELWKERFGSKPEDILAAIGPSIGGCCYEVDEKVAEPVRKNVPEWKEVLLPKPDGKYQLDLREANGNLLKKEGIRPENLELSTLCTSCHTDRFFSFRKESGRTGRMTAFVGLLDEVV